MKSLKTFLLAAAGLALGHTLSAQTVIYIAGSNGDRAATNTAIPKLLTGTLTWAGSNASPASANYGIWTGGSFNGTPVTIKVSFIGATGAIKALAGGSTVPFLPNGTTGTSSSNDPTTLPNPDNHVPDFITSSNFQSTSPYIGTYQGTTYATLVDTLTGVLPMKWLASPGFTGTNFTTQLAQLLYKTGAVPLALFTGSSADQHKIVYAIGRNTDAGQRYIVLTESGLGVNAIVKQYKASITGTSTDGNGFVYGGTVNSHTLWPVETVSGVSSQFAGNSGYTTGANLAPVLTATLGSAAYKLADSAATAGYYIGYLTETDANTRALTHGAVELKWNGVTESDIAIQQGQYTFWGYSHILRKSTLTSGTAFNFYTALRDQIKNTDANVAGLLISTMNVQRDGEGTPVYASYF
jgi:hypothetical protein